MTEEGTKPSEDFTHSHHQIYHFPELKPEKDRQLTRTILSFLLPFIMCFVNFIHTPRSLTIPIAAFIDLSAALFASQRLGQSVIP